MRLVGHILVDYSRHFVRWGDDDTADCEQRKIEHKNESSRPVGDSLFRLTVDTPGISSLLERQIRPPLAAFCLEVVIESSYGDSIPIRLPIGPRASEYRLDSEAGHKSRR